jgi:hypothetical protein
MNDALHFEDLDHLARVAEGRVADVPEAAVSRLILAGLVRRPAGIDHDAPALELTPAGLARIRSSDQ